MYETQVDEAACKMFRLRALGKEQLFYPLILSSILQSASTEPREKLAGKSGWEKPNRHYIVGHTRSPNPTADQEPGQRRMGGGGGEYKYWKKSLL